MHHFFNVETGAYWQGVKELAYRRLGDYLVSSGVLTEEHLGQALRLQKKSGKRLGTVLVENGFVTQKQIISTLERQLGVDYIDLDTAAIPPGMAKLLPRAIAKQYGVVPVRSDGDTLYIAMDDPLNFIAIEAAGTAAGRHIVPMIATDAGITHALAALYGSEDARKAIRDLKAETFTGDAQEAVAENIIGADDENAAPTIRLVNSILEYAISEGASDIHLEPREGAMAVRIRIDGILHRVFTVPRSTQNAVVSRIKVMGNMNVAEHKVPLDGRCNVIIGGRDVDLRISTLPTINGEKVVIRLLNKASGIFTEKGIGLTGRNLEKFDALMKSKNGIILIVGPTGSGKSSTMYAMINRLNTEEVNLVTLEDPVEYNIDGVSQVQINDKTGMTFASGLRSALRQDPDIICIGEIRDGETARIAMRAAVTGHLVLSTIHTNDAPGAIDRLLDIGVEPYLVSSALKGVISQRLVRCICPNCRAEYPASAEEQKMLRLPVMEGRKFYRGTGCPACFGTGYRGRTGVFEILTMNQELAQAVENGARRLELLSFLTSGGNYEPLAADCARLVAEGVTTFEEAFRTIHSADF